MSELESKRPVQMTGEVDRPEAATSPVVESIRATVSGQSFKDQVHHLRPPYPRYPGLQMMRSGGPEQPSLSVHEVAREGARGSGGCLPHLAQIQRSFGDHDMSTVRAHLDDQASRANIQLGAQAYASGEHIAFREPPALRTAAHEAAHVVQQRAGIDLPGGVGSPGDRYEQQADAVAERVVAGRSAGDLLDQVSAASRSFSDRGAVQREQDDVDEEEPAESEGEEPQEPTYEDFVAFLASLPDGLTFWDLGNEGWYLTDEFQDDPVTPEFILKYARKQIEGMSDQDVVNLFYQHGEEWDEKFKKLLVGEFRKKKAIDNLIAVVEQKPELFSSGNVQAMQELVDEVAGSPHGGHFDALLNSLNVLLGVAEEIASTPGNRDYVNEIVHANFGSAAEMELLVGIFQQMEYSSVIAMLSVQPALCSFLHNQVCWTVDIFNVLASKGYGYGQWVIALTTWSTQLVGYWMKSYVDRLMAPANTGLGNILILLKRPESDYSAFKSMVESGQVDVGPNSFGASPSPDVVNFQQDREAFCQGLFNYHVEYSTDFVEAFEQDFEAAANGFTLAELYLQQCSKYDMWQINQVLYNLEGQALATKPEGLSEKVYRQMNPVLLKIDQFRQAKKGAKQVAGYSFDTVKAKMGKETKFLASTTWSSYLTWKNFHQKLEEHWFVNLVTSSTDDMAEIVEKFKAVYLKAAAIDGNVQGASHMGDLLAVLEPLDELKAEIEEKGALIGKWQNSAEKEMTSAIKVCDTIKDICIATISSVVGGLAGPVFKAVFEGLSTMYISNETDGQVNWKKAILKAGKSLVSDLIGMKIKAKYPCPPFSELDVFGRIIAKTTYDHCVDTFRKTVTGGIFGALEAAAESKGLEEILGEAWDGATKVLKDQTDPMTIATRLIKTGAVDVIKVQWKAEYAMAQAGTKAMEANIKASIVNLKGLWESVPM
ncbi:MAG: DUF4157 domain-containing protein [Bradymonadales bacterium]|nr:DUF4157 domain-containing protein [Bradymonadales bacterium]